MQSTRRPTVDPVAAILAGRGVRVLGVWAHPDDEAYLTAGLMARVARNGGRVARNGGRVACVTATRGERGVPDDDPRPRPTIERMREAELRASLGIVGAHSLRILGHPDGECARLPHERGTAQVVAALHAVRPDVVVTFGPDGITGHPDHLAVHRWVTDAWKRSGVGQLLYAVMTDDFLDRHRALHERIGLFGDHEPTGVATGAVALRVELDDGELDRKRRALAAHASQTTALAAAMGEATYRRWWSSETFRRPRAADVVAACARSALAGASR